jgi:L-amino acid N-acyltransferase YncA
VSVESLTVFSLALDPLGAPAPQELRLRWLSTDEVWAAFDVLALDYEEKWLARRLAAGGRLAVAEADGRIVGWNIYQLGEVEQSDWFTVVLPADAMIATGGFVIPEFRGRRVLAAIKRFAGQSFHARGIRRMISISETANRASMNAHRNVGAVQIMSLSRRRLAGVDLIRVGRRWMVRRSPSTRVAIRIA